MEGKDKDDDNNKDDNADKSISDLELDRDVGFSREHQENHWHRPHDDDNEEEEEDVEDNNKEDDNNKDNNDENGISAQGLDRDLGFLRERHGYQRHPP